MEYSVELLLEGRKEDAYEKYVRSGKVPQNLFNRLVNGDPSGNQKYLMWMLGSLEKVGAGNEERYYMNLVEDVTFFHNNIQSFSNKDINSYNWESFTEEVGDKRAEIEEKQTLKQAKKESIRIYEDGRLLILIPKSYQSSCTYGAGTRWCTTMKYNEIYYKQHSQNGTLIYVIRKGIPESDNLHKIAFYLPNDNDSNIQIFNAPDNRVELPYIKEQLGEDVWDSIRQPIMDYLSDINSERTEYFMTEDEIISYLESGNINILKFGTKRLMQIFKTFDKLTEFIESKGLNPLYELPPRMVLENMGLQVRDYLDYYNVNIFDFSKYLLEVLGDPMTLISINNLFKGWRDGDTYDFDVLFEELEKSTFGDFETFFRFVEENSTSKRELILSFYKEMFNRDTSLMYDYFNSYNKDVVGYMDAISLYGLLKDGTVNYVKDFDKLEEFTDTLIKTNGVNLDLMIGMGYSSDDIKYLVEEHIIPDIKLDLMVLRYAFYGDGEAGLEWFFNNYRMDNFLTDMGDYSISFINLVEVFGSSTFKFIEGQLMSLGKTDDEDLHNFIGEQITNHELFEFFEGTNDIEKYMDAVDNYGKEITQLMEIKVLYHIHYGTEKDTPLYKKLKANVIGQITDLEIKGDDVYLINNSWCDFKEWVSSYSEDMFQYYFCEEDYREMFDDTYYNWYDDVWEEINKENMVKVRNYIKRNHNGEEVTYEDSDSEEKTVTLTTTFIDEVSDSELGLIVDNYLDELKGELSNAYHWGYNQAYESQFSDEVMLQIFDYLGATKEGVKWSTKKLKNYNGVEFDKTILTLKCDFNVILHNLNELSNGILEWDGDTEDFEYSDYTDLISEFISEYGGESISVNMPDHPYNPEKHFNELIGDYI